MSCLRWQTGLTLDLARLNMLKKKRQLANWLNCWRKLPVALMLPFRHLAHFGITRTRDATALTIVQLCVQGARVSSSCAARPALTALVSARRNPEVVNALGKPDKPVARRPRRPGRLQEELKKTSRKPIWLSPSMPLVSLSPPPSWRHPPPERSCMRRPIPGR